MFMAQCFRFGWRRCSPLNWALVVEIWHGQYLINCCNHFIHTQFITERICNLERPWQT
ncbi:hypothetical protein GZ633_004644 [Vibrio parahaemolyticus]|nr:hypothetical protein [Vibrio parahaemolyticus]